MIRIAFRIHGLDEILAVASLASAARLPSIEHMLHVRSRLNQRVFRRCRIDLAREGKSDRSRRRGRRVTFGRTCSATVF